MGKWKWKSLSRVQLFVTPWTIYSLPGSSVHVMEGFQNGNQDNFLGHYFVLFCFLNNDFKYSQFGRYIWAILISRFCLFFFLNQTNLVKKSPFWLNYIPYQKSWNKNKLFQPGKMYQISQNALDNMHKNDVCEGIKYIQLRENSGTKQCRFEVDTFCFERAF